MAFDAGPARKRNAKRRREEAVAEAPVAPAGEEAPAASAGEEASVRAAEKKAPARAAEKKAPAAELKEGDELDSVSSASSSSDDGSKAPSDHDDGGAPRAHGPLKGLANAFNTIMGRPLKAKRVAILCETGVEKELNEARHETHERARRVRASKILRDAAHVLPDPMLRDFERDLRRIATRGVVRLFNTMAAAAPAGAEAPVAQKARKVSSALGATAEWEGGD